MFKKSKEKKFQKMEEIGENSFEHANNQVKQKKIVSKKVFKRKLKPERRQRDD